jgi:hypothetical protein
LVLKSRQGCQSALSWLLAALSGLCGPDPEYYFFIACLSSTLGSYVLNLKGFYPYYFVGGLVSAV